VLGDGTTAKCYSFDDETQFEQNTLLLKLLQKKGLTLSMGEDEDLRHFCTSMDMKTQPAANEFMMDIQTESLLVALEAAPVSASQDSRRLPHT
jgi:hypothetical protein